MVHAVCWRQTMDKVVRDESLLIVTGNGAEQGVWVTQLVDLHKLLVWPDVVNEKDGIWT